MHPMLEPNVTALCLAKVIKTIPFRKIMQLHFGKTANEKVGFNAGIATTATILPKWCSTFV